MTGRVRSDGFQARAKKGLGQHFLTDPRVLERIVAAVRPQPRDALVEIGPGRGALTFALLARVERLVAIEFDRDLIGPLAAAAARLPGTALDLIEADALNVDFSMLAKDLGQPLRLVGNLPYNLSTPILFHALSHAASIADMHFMLQKEVVDRMAATPGGRTYGRLTVMLQAVARVEPMFDVPPSAFVPPPKVDSAVVRIVPDALLAARIADPERFAAVVRQAFATRRKTLRNALRHTADTAMLEKVGIDPSARAETIAPEHYVDLANALTVEDEVPRRDPPGIELRSSSD